MMITIFIAFDGIQTWASADISSWTAVKLRGTTLSVSEHIISIITGNTYYCNLVVII